MILLISGEDQTSSRNHLRSLREQFTGEIEVITPENLTPEKLAQAVETSSLFSSSRLVILDGVFAGKKAVSLPPYELKETNLIVYEGKKLSASQISAIQKIFPQIQVLEFKQNNVVFRFVESLRPGNRKQMLSLFADYLKVEIPEIIFAMITRQFRLLLLAKSKATIGPDEWSRLPSWQRSKLEAQASLYSPQALKSIYARLLDIDFQNKSGQSPLDLRGALELLLLRL